MNVRTSNAPTLFAVPATAGLLALPAVAWWESRGWPAWAVMSALAGSEFLALKFATLVTAAEWRTVPLGRRLAYVGLWPGMEAKTFLFNRAGRTPVAPRGELAWTLLKLLGGLSACAWATAHAGGTDPMLVGWVGTVGLIFVLHFGLLHAVSWCWRRAGVDAPPIMRAPIAADSLASFWGGRWNKAFADAARRLLFRPMARRVGALGAGLSVFLVSGLVHETVISLPAGGGWGGPTLYFLLQGGGVAVEKSVVGKKLGLGKGIRGWTWMAFCTAGPLPLLFHAPFVHRVIVPLFQKLQELMP